MTLAIRNLAVGYARTRATVLAGLSLDATPGAFVCILGRNGAGKSTLMRTLAGLQPRLDGTVTLDNEDVAAMASATRARRIAVVVTERTFSPGLKTEDVVALGRHPFTDWRGRLTAQDEHLASGALEDAGAAGFRGRYFDDLSDGERQRVLIARAIAQTPRMLVLDEITAFLDLPGRVEVMMLLRRHARESGALVLLSSHDLDLSLQLADTVWLLDGRGNLQVGRPDELVAEGHIGAAFDTPEVAFSRERSRFELSGALEDSPR